MVIIYDFDGTLTPYSLPQYKVFEKCGCTAKTVADKVNEIIENSEESVYEVYYKCYRELLLENGVKMSRDNVCLGSESVVFNKGVVEYFEKFQSSKTGIKHYIVTSGIKDYVDETKIGRLVDGVFGTVFDYNR